MDFSDERWVKLYVRDTPTWCLWDWEARAVFCFLLRVVDRAGVMDLGKRPEEALSVLIRVPLAVARRSLKTLQNCGTITVNSRGTLIIHQFLPAQTARQKNRHRQEASREFRRLNMQNYSPPCHTVSHGVTRGHTASQMSHDVTTRGEERRLEETRLEKIPTPLPPSGAAALSLNHLLSESKATYEAARPGDPFKPPDKKELAAARKLLTFATSEQICARLKIGLEQPLGAWLAVSNLSDLLRKWDQLGAKPDMKKPPSPGVFTETKDITNEF